MPQGVRLHVFRDARSFRVCLHDHPQCNARERATAVIEEKLAARVRSHEMRPTRREIGCVGVAGFPSDRNNALFGTFAEDAEKSLLQIDLMQHQRRELRDPETARIEKFQHCAIPQSARISAR